MGGWRGGGSRAGGCHSSAAELVGGGGLLGAEVGAVRWGRPWGASGVWGGAEGYFEFEAGVGGGEGRAEEAVDAVEALAGGLGVDA